MFVLYLRLLKIEKGIITMKILLFKFSMILTESGKRRVKNWLNELFVSATMEDLYMADRGEN